MQEGHGICQWADGSAYKGTWKGGERDGKGFFKRPDNYAYEGEWCADAQHGHGICLLEDGSRSTCHLSIIACSACAVCSYMRCM